MSQVRRLFPLVSCTEMFRSPESLVNKRSNMPSANFQGMDIQQVRQVSGETRERAQEINQLAQRVTQDY